MTTLILSPLSNFLPLESPKLNTTLQDPQRFQRQVNGPQEILGFIWINFVVWIKRQKMFQNLVTDWVGLGLEWMIYFAAGRGYKLHFSRYLVVFSRFISDIFLLSLISPLYRQGCGLCKQGWPFSQAPCTPENFNNRHQPARLLWLSGTRKLEIQTLRIKFWCQYYNAADINDD